MRHLLFAVMHGGIEWLVDAHDCSPDLLRDRAAVVGLLDRLVREMKLTVLATAVHAFPGEGGITAMYLLAESHLTIHTFPESGTATLNAYCCSPRQPAAWPAIFSEALGAGGIDVRELARGRAP